MASMTSIDDLKRQAIHWRGPSAVLGIASYLAFIAGVAIMIGGWLGRGEPLVRPWFGALITVAAVAGMTVGGHLHERQYLKDARRAGLSESEAKALADQADEELDD